MQSNYRALTKTLILSGIVHLAVSPAANLVHAQAAPASEPPRVEKINVTGSSIKRIEAESNAPITIVTREEIERSGMPTMTDLLRSLTVSTSPGFGQASDLSGSGSFSFGATGVNLRGLGSSATLVLLNGRRIAPLGLANPNFGQSTFVNIDSLPLSVVERVEVLRDGASAIYGSDAVAGVINIITRRDFKGALVNGSFSMNTDSEYKTERASTTIGFGDPARDQFNVFINLEGLKREQTRFRDVENFLNRQILRDNFSTGVPTSSFAGNYYRPVRLNPVTGLTLQSTFLAAAPNCTSRPNAQLNAAGQCIYDNWQGAVISPETERMTAFVRGTLDISATTSAFAEFSFNRTETNYAFNPVILGDGAWAQYYSATQRRLISPPELLPVGHQSNPYPFAVSLRHRFSEIGPQQQQLETTAIRTVLGFKWVMGSWDMEAGLSDSRNQSDAREFNLLRLSAINDAVNNNGYNFLNPSAGRLKPADLSASVLTRGQSSTSNLDFKVSRELFNTPGGAAAIAIGADIRREAFKTDPDAAILAGEIIGKGATSADGKRTASALYAELSLPASTAVEFQLAMRTDKFSDYGRSTTPKVGVLWKIMPTLRFRASFAEGFRAPSLTESSKSSVTAFINNFIDPRRCPTTRPLIDDCRLGYSFPIFIEANPGIQPETSNSHNVGFSWEPVKNLLVSADYFQVRRSNEIGTISVLDIIDNEGGNNPIYVGRLGRDLADPDGRVGRITSIRSGYVNSSKTIVEGVDTDISYQHSLGAFGRLALSASATYFINYKLNNEDDSYSDFAGVRAIPRTRGSANTTWTWRDYAVTLGARYTGRTTARQNSVNPCAVVLTNICSIPALTTYDLSVRYSGIKNTTLRFAVQNIGRTAPPLDPASRPVNSLLYSNALTGAYMTLSAEYRFK
jgi:iron complex outermembrane recepter protein